MQFLSEFQQFLCGNWQSDSKIDTELQGTQNSQNSLLKEK